MLLFHFVMLLIQVLVINSSIVNNLNDSLIKQLLISLPNSQNPYELDRTQRALHSFRINPPTSLKLTRNSIYNMFKDKKLEELRTVQQEYENQIYRDHLANKVRSSILKDFLTTRY